MRRAALLVIASASAALSALTASSASADCKEDILKVLDRLQAGGPYRTDATVTADGKTATVESIVVPPRDMYSRQTVGERTSEVLRIGPRIWLKRDQDWREAPAAAAAKFIEQIDGIKLRVPNLITDTDCPGQKTIDGKDQIVLTYRIDMPGQGSARNTIYLNPADQLPQRMTVEEGTPVRRTEMRYTFDDTLKLEAPKLEPPKIPGVPSEPPAPDQPKP